MQRRVCRRHPQPSSRKTRRKQPAARPPPAPPRRKTDRRRPAFRAGNEIRTHDFNLGNIRLASNTIRETQQHQRQSVPWRCVPSRGVPCKVEGWGEDLGWRQALLKPSVDFVENEQVDITSSTTQFGSPNGPNGLRGHGNASSPSAPSVARATRSYCNTSTVG